MRLGLKAIIAGCVILAITGCGGGSSGVGNFATVMSGSLGPGDLTTTDGGYGDLYKCVAGKSGTATIQVSSDDFDAVIQRYSTAGDRVEEEDQAGTGEDETMRVSVDKDDVIYIGVVPSLFSVGTGRYKIRFSSEFGVVTPMTTVPWHSQASALRSGKTGRNDRRIVGP
jgi:hypothetical protein